MDSRQHLLFDTDAHNVDDSETSSDTIEMTGLEDIPVTPARTNTYGTAQYTNGPHDSDDDSDDDDEGEQALLGSRTRTRGRERSPEGKPSVFGQVKRIVIETAPTLLLTTTGLLFTGEILDIVSHWKAMSQIDELIMIIPVILNLKGNLEMNLSARLGTAANMGDLDHPSKRHSIILGNLSLLQVQATIVSFVAVCVSFLMNRIMEASGESNPQLSGDVTMDFTRGLYARGVHKPKPHKPPLPLPPSGPAEFAMVASSAMCAACASSILLGAFMCMLVVVCRRLGLDPDNIAPPVAACLGDLVTLSLLGVIAELHLYILHTPIPLIIVLTLVVAAVGWTFVTNRNENVKHLLREGWSPLFIAMAISSGTGIVLDTFVERYSGFALLAVVITGLPGGVSSIFVSRLSTALHAATAKASSLLSSVQDLDKDKHHPSPRLVMVTLIAVSIPIEIAFLTTVHLLGWIKLPFLFIVLQVLFFLIAITISLLMSQLITTLLWKRGLDPDMYALPCQSALTDLVGQLLLVACYELASLLGAQVALKHKH
ncbi:Solute carrier family 41 member 2 [Trametes pubescens]|uniref:Solute carrier family 41 member 2 n=1 Tax=Trametes pubescens TaxID=154538 RepID=A0A1M2VZR4_TRAPU|nr:Solute carrier family 41 member 2 [Trametes pubescens]